MPLKIVRDDLANMRADAIVVPANEQLIIDGGTGLAVAEKAGVFRVRRACRKAGRCKTGAAVATPAFSFPAKYLIHAVGPVWSGTGEDAHLLRSAYDAALRLAVQLKCESIALPLLSAGTFGCPAHISLSMALSSIESVLSATDLDVTLVLFDKRAVAAGLDFIGELESRIDDAYVEESVDNRAYRAAQCVVPLKPDVAALPPDLGAAPSLAPAGGLNQEPLARSSERRSGRKLKTAREEDSSWGSASGAAASFDAVCMPEPCAVESDADATEALEQRFGSMDEGFSSTLLSLIDESGMTDAQVYRRANMSRQHFSKIRSNAGYHPSKATVLALCVALELSLAQTRDLLARAGFAFSHASKFDIIVEYFIERAIYDQFKINETLFYFDQPLLGG